MSVDELFDHILDTISTGMFFICGITIVVVIITVILYMLIIAPYYISIVIILLIAAYIIGYIVNL